MEVLRANIRERETLHRVEKDGKTVGERDRGRVRSNKKIIKKEYLNKVLKKIKILIRRIL